MSPPELHPELWSHICSYLYQPPPSTIGAPGMAWRELHQHDLTAMMRVNSTMHDAAAPHLYHSVAVTALGSLFHNFEAAQPTNRLGKRAQLGMVKHLTLSSPKTYTRSSRREPSPTVFLMDPVYPYPDSKILRIVDACLEALADLASRLSTHTEPALLPQLEQFTLTSLNNDKWDLIERHILSGPLTEPRYQNYRATSTLFAHIVNNAKSDIPLTRNWRLWPVNGPYSKSGEIIFDLSPKNAVLTQHIDTLSMVLPDIQLNRLVLLNPLITQHTIPRYLNWPELKGRLRVAMEQSQDMKVEIHCRLAQTPFNAKEKQDRRRDRSRARREMRKEKEERVWELDMVDEINETVEKMGELWKDRVKLVWTGDEEQGLPVVEERRGR